LNESLLVLESICEKIDLKDREKLITCVNTALSSKVVCGNSKELSPIAVDAVLKIYGIYF
jgi:T-complex protein 1 subunit delta